MQIACDPKHNKLNFTGNRYLREILSQQKQFCPLVRPDPNRTKVKDRHRRQIQSNKQILRGTFYSGGKWKRIFQYPSELQTEVETTHFFV